MGDVDLKNKVKMKIFQLSKMMLVLLGGLYMMSFVSGDQPVQGISGTYGICDGQDGVLPAFELVLNEDFTFRYMRRDNADEPIDVKGKWSMSGKHIVLKADTPEVSIHDKWKVDEQCLKSKRGFEWTRLCRVKPGI
jgi:hypothetical protein